MTWRERCGKNQVLAPHLVHQVKGLGTQTGGSDIVIPTLDKTTTTKYNERRERKIYKKRKEEKKMKGLTRNYGLFVHSFFRFCFSSLPTEHSRVTELK